MFKQYHRADRASHRDFLLEYNAESFTAFGIVYDYAVGEGVNKAVDVSVIQCFVAMGSNCVPIPGAMGVADYIMIDGFKQLVGRNAANMELLCRGMTFYGSVIISAVIILIGYIIRKKVAK